MCLWTLEAHGKSTRLGLNFPVSGDFFTSPKSFCESCEKFNYKSLRNYKSWQILYIYGTVNSTTFDKADSTSLCSTDIGKQKELKDISNVILLKL